MRHTFTATLEAERAKLTSVSRELFAQLTEECCALDQRLAYYNEKIAAICEAHPVCERLGTMPGIGPLTATALVAAVSDANHCKNGRQCAAWVGLVPRHHSTGGKARLRGMSKRGDSYLRKLRTKGFQKVTATDDAQQLAPVPPIGMAVGTEIPPAHPAAIDTIRVGAELV